MKITMTTRELDIVECAAALMECRAPYGPHALYMTHCSHLHLVWQGDFESLEAATDHATAKAAEWLAEAS